MRAQNTFKLAARVMFAKFVMLLFMETRRYGGVTLVVFGFFNNRASY